MLSDLEQEIAKEFCWYCHTFQAMNVLYGNTCRNYKEGLLANDVVAEDALIVDSLGATQRLIRRFRLDALFLQRGINFCKKLTEQGIIPPGGEIPFSTELVAHLSANYMKHVRNLVNT